MKALLVAILLLGVSGRSAVAQKGDNPTTAPPGALALEVISERPHAPGTVTQGLVLHEGMLYESAGDAGTSTLRRVDPVTGQIIQSVNLPPDAAAGGLALIDGALVMINRAGPGAFLFDPATLAPTGRIEAVGPGWGLCADGGFVYMTDGGPFLDLRLAATFDLIFSGLVTAQGSPVDQLDELECVGDYVYANIAASNAIAQIDKTNGVIVNLIDAKAVVPEVERARLGEADTMNGIAYDPASDTFLITGRRWPKVYEVRIANLDTTGRIQ